MLLCLIKISTLTALYLYALSRFVLLQDSSVSIGKPSGISAPHSGQTQVGGPIAFTTTSICSLHEKHVILHSPLYQRETRLEYQPHTQHKPKGVPTPPGPLLLIALHTKNMPFELLYLSMRYTAVPTFKSVVTA